MTVCLPDAKTGHWVTATGIHSCAGVHNSCIQDCASEIAVILYVA